MVTIEMIPDFEKTVEAEVLHQELWAGLPEIEGAQCRISDLGVLIEVEIEYCGSLGPDKLRKLIRQICMDHVPPPPSRTVAEAFAAAATPEAKQRIIEATLIRHVGQLSMPDWATALEDGS